MKAMLDSEYIAKKPYLKAIVLLFLHTGLRIGDVIEQPGEHLAIPSMLKLARGRVVRMAIHSKPGESVDGAIHIVRKPASKSFALRVYAD